MYVEPLGKRALFLVPSQKVFKTKDPATGRRVVKTIHDFLVQNFGGFTMASGNINGYFEDNEYDEHREYRAAFADDEQGTKLRMLQEFLARICLLLGEVCIYLEYGERAMLVYPGEAKE